ncbi:MAG: hypothetical protein K5897_02860 [Eubacterium sp.]|nr:hypothetical protein [Eubacterium sp.]
MKKRQISLLICVAMVLFVNCAAFAASAFQRTQITSELYCTASANIQSANGGKYMSCSCAIGGADSNEVPKSDKIMGIISKGVTVNNLSTDTSSVLYYGKKSISVNKYVSSLYYVAAAKVSHGSTIYANAVANCFGED